MKSSGCFSALPSRRGQHVIDGSFQAHLFPRSPTPLVMLARGIDIHEKDPSSLRRQGRCEVDRSGGFPDSALLIGYCLDLIHPARLTKNWSLRPIYESMALKDKQEYSTLRH